MEYRLKITILAVLLAASRSSAVQSAQRHDAKPAFSIAISVLMGSVEKVGSPLMLKVVKTNTSDHDIFVSSNPGPRLLRFDVFDAEGRPVPETAFGIRIHSSLPVQDLQLETVVVGPIKPGQTLKGKLDLSKQFDISKPGQYTIQAHELDPWSDSLVKSNTISVMVTDSPQDTQSLQRQKTSFKLLISTLDDEVKPDSEITLDIDVTNTADHEIVYDPVITLDDADVRDSQGNMAPLKQAGRELGKLHGGRGSNSFSVSPGETTPAGGMIVSKAYDMTHPGKYTIQVSRVDEETKAVVKSNIITVTVVP